MYVRIYGASAQFDRVQRLRSTKASHSSCGIFPPAILGLPSRSGGDPGQARRRGRSREAQHMGSEILSLGPCRGAKANVEIDRVQDHRLRIVRTFEIYHRTFPNSVTDQAPVGSNRAKLQPTDDRVARIISEARLPQTP